MRAAVLSAVLLGLVLASCALVTFGGSDYGTTCGFSGRDKGCGKCIAGSCQKQVDACCADATCRKVPDDSTFGVSLTNDPGTLAKLDTCASGGSCRDLEGDRNADAIRQCIEDKCQGECDLWRYSTLHADATSCKVESASSTSPERCSCQVPGTTEDAPTAPNSVACSSGLCCADKDWPGPASKCNCQPIQCHLYSSSCACEVFSLSEQPVDECSRGTCCLSPSEGSCSCWTDRGCQLDEIPVQKCTADLVWCGSNQRTVDRCSAN